jgi:hypothetical protein
MDSVATIQEIFTNVTSRVEGSIATPGVYTVFYYAPFSGSTNIKVNADFSNPGTRLDARAIPELIEQPIALAIFGVVLLLWMINWFMNCALRIYIHFCITAMFVLGFFSRICSYANLKYTDQNDASTGIQLLFIIFEVLFLMSVYTVILLCAKGWCIVRRSVKISEFVRALVIAISFLLIQAVVEYVALTRWLNLIALIVMLFLVILYVRELIRSIHLGEMYIMAHLLEISNAGIDPETTPIWPKRKMFDRLQYCIIAYCILMLIQLGSVVFAPNSFWVHRMMQDIADISILIGIGLVYRLRGGRHHGFSLVEETGEGLLSLEDFEPVETTQPLRKGGRRWEAGMLLPPPPGAAQTRAAITLEAPDGLFDITVRVDTPEVV